VPADPPGDAPTRFHASMAGYAPTPLVSARGVADALGVADVLVKDESARLDLPSFKILGASWATRCALVAHAAVPESQAATFADLSRLAERLKPLTLAAATDGNHGRAVARMARLLGFEARIYVPAGTAEARIAALAAEGADVTVVEGGYDDAVRRSAEDSGARCLVISDTSWNGYEEVPRQVIAGYETIFAEIDAAVGGGGLPQPNVVAVPIGVGALAAAAAAQDRKSVV
jgi:diaminopropionate ammonia-lyase